MRKIITFLFILIISISTMTLTACDSPEDKFANYIQRGNELFQKEEYKKARLEYKNAAKIDPTSAKVLYHLGLVDEAQGDIHNAYANFVNSEQQDKNYPPTLLKLAQYYMSSDQLDEAISRLNTIFKTEPNNANAIAILAAVELRQNKINQAEKDAIKALSIDKKNITATAVLTGLYQKQKNIEKAGDILETGIKNNPSDISLLILKVSLYKKAKMFEKVKEAYNSLFKLKPENKLYRQSFVSELLKEKLYDEAKIFMGKNISDFPKSLEMKKQFIQFLSRKETLETTEKEIKSYIKNNPDKDIFYFWLADLYITHKDTQKAANLLNQIVQKDTDNKTGLNAKTTLARINIVKGDRSLAEKLIKSVLKTNPTHQDALYIRANLSYKDGNYRQAITDLRTIIRDNPKISRAYQLLAEVLLTQGKIDLAIDTLGQLLEIKPMSGMAIRVRLAQMFEANNNPNQGLLVLKTVTKTKPNYFYGWESTARLSLSANKLKLAKEAINKIKNIKGYESTASFLNSKLLIKEGKKIEAKKQLEKLIRNTYTQPISEHAIKTLKETTSIKNFISFLESLKNKTPFIYNQLGDLYLSQKEYELAKKSYKESIKKQPRKAEPFVNLAKIHLRNNNLDKAYALLEKAMSIDPTNYLAPIIAADILKKQSKFKEAIKLYEKILQKNSDVKAAANNMADLISNKFSNDKSMMEKARLVAERFISSTNPLLLDTLAWVYYKQGKVEQALTIIQRAISINNKLPAEIHYHYGKILFDTKHHNMAKIQFKKAINSKENFEGKKDAIKLLKKIK